MKRLVDITSVEVDDEQYTGIDVQLPQTRLLAIRTEKGYVMCGALDVNLLRTRLASREILAARAVGVRTLQELLDGTVDACTQKAEELGIHPGMPIREALLRMRRHERLK